MKTDTAAVNGVSLLLTYIGDDKGRKFDILVNGEKIATETWNGGTTGKFYNKIYAFPASAMKNMTSVRIRIAAAYDKTAGRVFGARIIRN